jgi:hypothetical protein
MNRATLAILAALSASLALADDFKTTDGKEYKNAKISRVEPDGIVIRFSGGVVKVPFAELSEELQRKYSYDPQAAAAYSAEQREQQAALALQRKADEQRKLEESQKYRSEHPTPAPQHQRSGNPSLVPCMAVLWIETRAQNPNNFRTALLFRSIDR